MLRRTLGACLLALALAGCPVPAERRWQLVTSGLDEALLSVAGSSAQDVWAVGADAGSGPLVLHFDGTAWTRRQTGLRGTLWWAHALPGGRVLFGGVRGTILEWDGGAFVRHATPGLARQTVFGVWGASRDDVWAVGAGTSGRRGFLWHFDGSAWSDVGLPADVPLRAGEAPGLFKVWGSSADDVWAVGADGLVLHKGAGGWARLPVDRTDTLFTVSGRAGQVWITGGGRSSVLLEGDASGLKDLSPPGVALLQGVAPDPSAPGAAWAVGEQGAVYRRGPTGWEAAATGLTLPVESLHAVWVDPAGGVWAVGGKVLTDLTGGALLRLAPPGAATWRQPDKPAPPAAVCPQAAVDPAEGQSIARRWNEQILGAIRRDLPRPTVHARNLFHLSAALWDAWAAWDPAARGVFAHERAAAPDVEAARREALSYAALRLLDHRYAAAAGGAVSSACFRAFMLKLGYPPDDATLSGDSPRAVGNRVGQAVIDATREDGANEQADYADTTGFTSAAPALPVESPSPPAADIDLWQPLDLAIAATQNGIPLAPGVQKYVGAHWGKVAPFALVRPSPGAPYVDPGPPPALTPATMGWVVELIRRSAQLGVDPAQTIDISPGATGNNPLGTNAGAGHPQNPVTGQPYAPQVVRLGDFGRVLAEVWADGPRSETPPGHWNLIANQAFQDPRFARRWRGGGPTLAPLEWDVRAYLALNGALHDAAIAAWEVKRAFLRSRPITLIRTSAALGQSSDSGQAAYHPKGLPLVPGLIEVVTAASAAPGGRHAGLQNAVGQVAIRAWRGEPGDVRQVSGVGWLRGVEWVPYQKRDFVTPAFPGFISGHSCFSRAAAVTLAALTGSDFFPGGLGELPVAAGTSLTFEQGPSQPVVLQWATWFDAADQAGQSRLWGGIHIEADDFAGRRVGAQVGAAAAAKAESYFP